MKALNERLVKNPVVGAIQTSNKHILLNMEGGKESSTTTVELGSTT